MQPGDLHQGIGGDAVFTGFKSSGFAAMGGFVISLCHYRFFGSHCSATVRASFKKKSEALAGAEFGFLRPCSSSIGAVCGGASERDPGLCEMAADA